MDRALHDLAPAAATPPKAKPRGAIPKPVLWLGAAIVLALVLWLIVKFLFLKAEPEARHKVQQISLVRPPPPPPPPKPPEKPPEPPKIKEELKIEPPKPVDEPKPAQQPDAPPPGPLGVDAQGTGPGDGFGLAGRPGGRDVTLGGGGGGMSATLFANNVARHIAQELARMGPLRAVEYRVDLRVWLSRDGRVERHEIIRSSGDANVDRMIVDGLAHIGALRQGVPENMTQPLRIRVTSADA
ncbi:MAG: energy transducer TonB [Rhizobacter sp.]